MVAPKETRQTRVHAHAPSRALSRGVILGPNEVLPASRFSWADASDAQSGAEPDGAAGHHRSGKRAGKLVQYFAALVCVKRRLLVHVS